MSLKKDFYFLSPVEVVKVTSQNLQEVAEWCGGKVATTESRRVPGRQDSYVWVPTPKGTAISWAFPGMFITKRLVRTIKDELRITYAVFRRDYFEKNYFGSPGEAVEQTWEKGKSKKVKHPKHPEMAGKPAPLSLQVEIPPGSSAEDVKEAMQEAVGVLQAQGVLAPETIEDEALKAIANAPGLEAFKEHEEAISEVTLDTAEGLSPKEIHNAQVESASLDEQPNAFSEVVSQVEHTEAESVLPEAGEIVTTGTPETEEDGSHREIVPDHELRELGFPCSYQEGYTPIYRDEL